MRNLLKNRTVLGVACIAASLAVCFVVTPLFNASAAQKTEIVRVVKEIKEGDAVTRDMLQTVEVGGYHLPDGVLRDVSSAVGKYAASGLLPGDYLLPGKLLDEPAAENAYLYRLTGEKHAVSVTVRSLASGVSGKLRPGDVVSVIAPDFRESGETQVPPELRYVEVIAATAKTGDDAQREQDSREEEEKRLPSTVTLLASPLQCRLLAELEAEGTIHLSLVYRGDRENADRFLEEQDKVLKEAQAREDALALLENQDGLSQTPAARPVVIQPREP